MHSYLGVTISFFTSKILDKISDNLVDKGYIILDIKDPIIQSLAKHALELDNFTLALIGRDDLKQEQLDIRSDETVWLDEDNDVDGLYLKAMQSLQEGMNERLFMGLKYHEAHYSHYKPGTFYQKHLDAFRGKSSRKLTTVLYLNESWKADYGGDLLIYDEADNLLERVVPNFGRLVIFLSDSFPHEVLISNRDRYSIAGWFRID